MFSDHEENVQYIIGNEENVIIMSHINDCYYRILSSSV